MLPWWQSQSPGGARDPPCAAVVAAGAPRGAFNSSSTNSVQHLRSDPSPSRQASRLDPASAAPSTRRPPLQRPCGSVPRASRGLPPPPVAPLPWQLPPHPGGIRRRRPGRAPRSGSAAVPGGDPPPPPATYRRREGRAPPALIVVAWTPLSHPLFLSLARGYGPSLTMMSRGEDKSGEEACAMRTQRLYAKICCC